jgi:hypothetical protein
MEEKKLNLGKVLPGILIKEHLQQSFRDIGIDNKESIQGKNSSKITLLLQRNFKEELKWIDK